MFLASITSNHFAIQLALGILMLLPPKYKPQPLLFLNLHPLHPLRPSLSSSFPYLSPFRPGCCLDSVWRRQERSPSLYVDHKDFQVGKINMEILMIKIQVW